MENLSIKLFDESTKHIIADIFADALSGIVDIKTCIKPLPNNYLLSLCNWIDRYKEFCNEYATLRIALWRNELSTQVEYNYIKIVIPKGNILVLENKGFFYPKIEINKTESKIILEGETYGYYCKSYLKILRYWIDDWLKLDSKGLILDFKLSFMSHEFFRAILEVLQSDALYNQSLVVNWRYEEADKLGIASSTEEYFYETMDDNTYVLGKELESHLPLAFNYISYTR